MSVRPRTKGVRPLLFWVKVTASITERGTRLTAQLVDCACHRPRTAKGVLELMKYKNNYPLFSWRLCVSPFGGLHPRDSRLKSQVSSNASEPRPPQGLKLWLPLCLVVNILSVLRLWKTCTASVPDFAVQMYRKVPHSTAKRVKRFGPELVVEYRKVMATMMIRKVHEVPEKMFLPKCTAKSGIQKSALTHGST
jgi:hypothetical protein